MRDIPGFGVWLAIMTAMSGVVTTLGCGPDKPQVGGGVGGPGARPIAADAAAGGGAGGTMTRPPPVQPADGGAERSPPAMTTDSSAAGCAPAPPDGGPTPTRDGGGDSSSTGDATGDAGAPASGGRPGTGGGTGSGGADGTGGRAGTANGGNPATGGTPTTGGAGGRPGGSGGGSPSSGGAPGTGGRPATTGGAPGSGGTPGSGGAPSAGGAPGSGGAPGAAGSGGDSGGAGPAPGDLAIVELLINPAGTDTGREWIEILNRSGRALSLAGLHVADAANDAAVDFGGGNAVLPAGGRAVLVQSADPTKNGGIIAATAPVVGTFGTLVSLNNDADTISICAGICPTGGAALDRVAWDAALGTDYDGHALVIDDGGKRCPATAAFGDAGSFGTPGAPNAACP